MSAYVYEHAKCFYIFGLYICFIAIVLKTAINTEAYIVYPHTLFTNANYQTI